jgi:predicted nucleic acid-binding protein
MSYKVYVETSVISYLTGRPSRDETVHAHQMLTQQWWQGRGAEYELFISEYVIAEASKGDPMAAQQRLQALQGLSEIATSTDAEQLATVLIERGALPTNSRLDALHLAVSAVQGMDLLLTWNFKHLANAAAILKAEAICRDCGYEPPRIITPLQMIGD